MNMSRVINSIITGLIFTAAIVLFAYAAAKRQERPEVVCRVEWMAERRLGLDWPLGTDENEARRRAGGRMIYQGTVCN